MTIIAPIGISINIVLPALITVLPPITINPQKSIPDNIKTLKRKTPKFFILVLLFVQEIGYLITTIFLAVVGIPLAIKL